MQEAGKGSCRVRALSRRHWLCPALPSQVLLCPSSQAWSQASSPLHVHTGAAQAVLALCIDAVLSMCAQKLGQGHQPRGCLRPDGELLPPLARKKAH